PRIQSLLRLCSHSRHRPPPPPRPGTIGSHRLKPSATRAIRHWKGSDSYAWPKNRQNHANAVWTKRNPEVEVETSRVNKKTFLESSNRPAFEPFESSSQRFLNSPAPTSDTRPSRPSPRAPGTPAAHSYAAFSPQPPASTASLPWFSSTAATPSPA